MPAPRDPDITADLATTPPASSAPPASASTRLDAGTILASRYRIVAPLGRGGMGEVYRADDLELNSPIALKFLPPSLAADPVRLDQLRAEVRVARQVSHPNVCRVFDIAHADGRAFITMEHVDGEDLASLLKRIGRLPPDKAVQTARQVCFGLAAAHEQGLVHRDLKPANIMLDSRGNARVMDFGVAGLAAHLNAAGAVSAGTPIYMAPEQLEGREVTARSDLYSLGHVLYELFTGKPVFSRESTRTLEDIKSLHRSGSSVPRPSEHVDLDPAVERVILHCLEHDPAARPSSAVAVAAALPGGDPLAAALAAGETPSPELVALAGAGAGMPRKVAIALAALVALALIAMGALNDSFAVHRRIPFALAPDVLASRAREMVAAFTGAPAPAHEYWSLSYDAAMINRLARSGDADRWARVADADPPLIRFWYRAAPEALTPTAWWEKTIGPNSPPRIGEGVYIGLDTAARLYRFDRYSPDTLTPREPVANLELPVVAAGPDSAYGPLPLRAVLGLWTPFFKAAELDQASFKDTPPRLPPSVPADQRAAWTGPTPRDTQPALISAASLDGAPVLFDRRPDVPPAANDPPSPIDSALNTFGTLGIISGAVLAALFARANIRARRGDRIGAWRIAFFTLTVELLSMALPRNSLADVLTLEVVGRPLARALWIAAFAWVFYMALEPMVRRSWPQLLISWSRLIAGSWRDPLVARHALIGLAVGSLTSALYLTAAVFRLTPAGFTTGALQPRLGQFVGLRFSLGDTFSSTAATIALGLIMTLFLIGLKIMLKRLWLITPLVAVLFAMLFFGNVQGQPHLLATALLCGSALTALLVRAGFFPLVVALVSGSVFVNLPFTLDMTAWYASTSLAYAATAIGVAILAALTASRPTPRPAAA